MPVVVECSACEARLTLGDALYDRKVRGRVVTIGCKRCGADIRVDGRSPADGAADDTPSPPGGDPPAEVERRAGASGVRPDDSPGASAGVGGGSCPAVADATPAPKAGSANLRPARARQPSTPDRPSRPRPRMGSSSSLSTSAAKSSPTAAGSTGARRPSRPGSSPLLKSEMRTRQPSRPEVRKPLGSAPGVARAAAPRPPMPTLAGIGEASNRELDAGWLERFVEEDPRSAPMHAPPPPPERPARARLASAPVAVTTATPTPATVTERTPATTGDDAPEPAPSAGAARTPSSEDLDGIEVLVAPTEAATSPAVDAAEQAAPPAPAADAPKPLDAPAPSPQAPPSATSNVPAEPAPPTAAAAATATAAAPAPPPATATAAAPAPPSATATAAAPAPPPALDAAPAPKAGTVAAASAAIDSIPPFARGRSRARWLALGVAAIAVVGLGTALALQGNPSEPKEPDPPAPLATTQPAPPPPKPAEPASPETPPAPKEEPAAADTPSEEPPPAASAPTATPAPRLRRAPKPKPEPEPEPPPAPAVRVFDAAAAQSAVTRASGMVSYCPRKSSDPTGTATATVTFSPSGRSTAVVGPPFAGKPIGACITARLRQAKVPAFDGGPRSIKTRVTIR
ncbi:MAG TPA: hypothetical protein VKZ49_01870 [Polyangiaceae bacterium]|nr:hypothetical protein [Polyangiaceae bacterium]